MKKCLLYSSPMNIMGNSMSLHANRLSVVESCVVSEDLNHTSRFALITNFNIVIRKLLLLAVSVFGLLEIT